ncbi:MAG: dynamin family protein [Ignavibacteria bacterium]|nr:dynamin family protein [Ignavibacteria bacterium]
MFGNKLSTKLFNKYSDQWNLSLPVTKDDSLVRVMILGEFNAGKSSVTNALMNRDILPVDIFQTTATINRIKYSHQNYYEVVDLNDKVIKRDEDFSTLNNFNADFGTHENIKWINVYLSDFPEDIELIDTPGFNDPNPKRDQLFLSMLPTSDVLIFVSDANQGLKGSEIPYIQKYFLRYLNRINFVFNHSDTLDSYSKLNYVRNSIKESLSVLINDSITMFEKYGTDYAKELKNSFNLDEHIFFISSLVTPSRRIKEMRDSELEAELKNQFNRLKDIISGLAANKDNIFESIYISDLMIQLENRGTVVFENLSALEKYQSNKESLKQDLLRRIQSQIDFLNSSKKIEKSLPDKINHKLEEICFVELEPLSESIKSYGDDFISAYAIQFSEQQIQGIIEKMIESTKGILNNEISMVFDIDRNQLGMVNHRLNANLQTRRDRSLDMSDDMVKAGLAATIGAIVGAVFFGPIGEAIGGALVGGFYKMNSVKQEKIETAEAYDKLLKNIEKILINVRKSIVTSVIDSMNIYRKEMLGKSENVQWHILELADVGINADESKIKDFRRELNELQQAINSCNDSLIKVSNL